MRTRIDRLMRGWTLRALIGAAPMVWLPTDGSAQLTAADSLVVLNGIQETVGWYKTAEMRQTLDPTFDHWWVVAQLDSAAAILPADDWITGQRVGFRYLLGDEEGALNVALECRASTWWCAALTGYALHNMGLAAPADSAFDVALREMPASQRCAWSDLTPLLDQQTASAYMKENCALRADLERRIWWLADPLYLMPGNDRRGEHFARRVGLELNEESSRVRFSPGSYRPSESLSQITIRRGWSRTLWQYTNTVRDWIETPVWDYAAALEVVREARGFGFFPARGAILDPLSAKGSDLEVRWRVGHERYLPLYGVFRQLDGQVAAFIRGDSLLLIVASAMEDSLLVSQGPLRAGVVLARHEDDTPIVQIDHVHRDRYVFQVTLASERYLLSLEALGQGVFGRVRLGVGPPPAATGRMGISDLLLFEVDGDVPLGLDSAAERMLGTTRLPSDRSLGVYWELYNLIGGDIVTVALSVIPDRQPGVLRRFGEFVGILSAPAPPVKVSWREPDASPGVQARTLGMNLSQIPPGFYTLELVATNSDGGTAVARRSIEIVQADRS